MTRKISTKFSENDYHIFSKIANNSGLTVEEKLQEIVDMYILADKKRFRQDRF